MRNTVNAIKSPPPQRPDVPVNCFHVTFLDGSDSPKVMSIHGDRAGLIRRIEYEWTRLFPYRIPDVHTQIHVQYEVNNVQTVGCLETLARSTFVPAQLQTYIKILAKVKVYDYGSSRISSLTGKETIYEECSVSSVESFFHSVIMPVAQCKGVSVDSFNIVRSYGLETIRVDNLFDLLRYTSWHEDHFAVFYLSNHSNYNELNFAQLQELMMFQRAPNDNEENIARFTAIMKQTPKYHLKLLTENGSSDRLQAPMDQVKQLIHSSPENLQGFNEAKDATREMLGCISNNTVFKEVYGEKLRRSLVNIVVCTALGIANELSGSIHRNIVTDEAICDDEANGRIPSNFIGNGPLDYYTLPEGAVIVVQKADEGEERMTEEGEVALEEFAVKCNRSMKKLTPTFDIDDFKVNLDDSALYKLLAQMHDILLAKVKTSRGLKRKFETEVDLSLSSQSIVKLDRDRVVGILTTGHRVDVFSMTVNPTTLQKVVEFHGRRTLKILRYKLFSVHSSSFKVEDNTIKKPIEDKEVTDMLLLFIAVFMNFV